MGDRLVPPTLRGYRRSWFGADVLAGLALIAVALPSQMATARLADLPAVTGLYAFVAGSVLFALIGTKRGMSIGADSTIAPVLATGAASVAAIGTVKYGFAMAFTALAVGGLLVLIGICRLGWISEFLSTPVITGLLAGIAVEIVVRQLPAVLGLRSGGDSTIERLRHVVDEIGHVNGWALGIACGVLAAILVAKRIDHRWPGALFGLIASIVVVYAFGLASRHGVAVIGTVHSGLPHLGIPSVTWSEVRRLIAPALTVAFICIAQTAATARESNAEVPAANDFNQDLVAIGAGSVAAGFLGSFAVDASPPNTAILTASGARSQLANLVAVAVVIVVLFVAAAPLAHLPEATLGATLIYIATRLFRVRDLRAILRFDRLEFALSIITLLVVALVGIEQGVALAMVLSLADRTWRSARPRDVVLGREPGTDHWIPIDVERPTEQVPGVLVYLIYAPLWYADADYFSARVRELVDSAPSPLHAVIFDANAMSDIDYTGLQALRAVTTELRARGIEIGVARVSHLVHHDLKHGALIDELGADHLYPSVEEAVNALKNAATPESNPSRHV
jgi:sulfate permease, SulP family